MSFIGNSPKANRVRFQPQANAPSNAAEGDVYYDNGTNRLEGLYQFKDTAWVLVGSGTNDSLVQYITNGDAETGVTTGWSTYADAAQTSPVNGTGGVANVTIAASATAPLRGAYSFLLSKDANDRQGQGWSYDFSIDDADKAKVLTIAFDYIVASGTFAAGSSSTASDVTVWMYDVTNSQLIEPSSVKLFSNSSSISDVFEAQFQTSSTGSDYRLILHVGSTNAAAYELKVDNVRVSPSQYVYGTPITDWQSYVPTGSWVSNTTYTGLWRRVGDSNEYQVRVATTGTPTTATLTVNLPSGQVIDTSKLTAISTGNPLGIFHAEDVGTLQVGGIVAYNSATSVFFQYNTVTTHSGTAVVREDQSVTQAGPFSWANTDFLIARFSAPIVGQSSSVQTSDNADTRIVAAKLITAATTVGTGYTQLNLDTPTFDTHGARSANTYVIPVSGFYRIYGQMALANVSRAANSNVQFAPYVDNVISDQFVYKMQATASIDPAIQFSTTLQLNAGQVLTFFGASTGNSAALVTTASNTFINIERVTGPSAIAATETIAFTTAGNPSGTMTASFSDVNWSTPPTLDTHAAWNTSTGEFEAPATGIYQIDAQISITGTPYAATQSGGIAALVNGTIIRHHFIQSTASANVTMRPQVSVLVRLNAGDLVKVQGRSTGTSPALVAEDEGNYLNIHRVGL